MTTDDVACSVGALRRIALEASGPQVDGALPVHLVKFKYSGSQSARTRCLHSSVQLQRLRTVGMFDENCWPAYAFPSPPFPYYALTQRVAFAVGLFSGACYGPCSGLGPDHGY